MTCRVQAVFCLATFLLPLLGCFSASEISEAMAIALAREDLKHTALSLSGTTVSARKWSTPVNDVIKKDSASPHERRILAKLNGKVYWLVVFRPGNRQVGGGAAVFVDAMTGEILGSV